MFHSEKLWATTDDSAGEAFDKVAKMMGLEYPGWPIISELASQYTGEVSSRNKPMFPRVWLEKKWANFSFSGLKSAVKREVDKRWELTDNDKKQIAFEFQNAVIEVLAYKLVNLWLQKWVSQILLAGWVGANTLLREEIIRLAAKENLNFLYPKKLTYCMDNAAMIGILAYYKIKKWEE
jgi:N6-L-threonylcarbamoyladenine synthase